MNQLQDLFKLFNNPALDFEERNFVVDAKFKYNFKNPPKLERIHELLNTFPNRDDVQLVLENEMEDILYLKNNRLLDYTSKKQFLENTESEDTVSISLHIEKKIEDNKITVYNFEKFYSFILNQDLLETMKIFNKFLKNKEFLIFQLLDADLVYTTRSMAFISANAQDIHFDNNKRIERLEDLKGNCSFFNMPQYELLPEDFHGIVVSNDFIFEDIFKKIETILALIYISNTSFLDNDFLKVQITGQRTINFEILLNDTVKINPEIFRIYNWIFTDGNPIDKQEIARSVVCLHCKYIDILDLDERTYASIQSNFNLYQKKNVQKYLELKNKLTDYIIQEANNMGDLILNLSGKIKGNMLAVFTFIFTVVLANIVSDAPLNNVFTKDITLLLEIVLFASFIYLFITIKEINYKMNRIEKNYEDIKFGYTDLLDERDIEEIFNHDINFKDNKDEFKKKKKQCIILWILIITILIIILQIVGTDPFVISMINKIHILKP